MCKTRKNQTMIATFFGSIYGDFLYLGDYSNINNYNISFLFCQYICSKFYLTHKKSSKQRAFFGKASSVSVFIIAYPNAFVNFFHATNG
jgi:hypothetical protein